MNISSTLVYFTCNQHQTHFAIDIRSSWHRAHFSSVKHNFRRKWLFSLKRMRKSAFLWIWTNGIPKWAHTFYLNTWNMSMKIVCMKLRFFFLKKKQEFPIQNHLLFRYFFKSSFEWVEMVWKFKNSQNFDEKGFFRKKNVFPSPNWCTFSKQIILLHFSQNVKVL